MTIIKHALTILLLAGIAATAVGCASTPLDEKDRLLPTLVTLPISQAGIRDSRPEFSLIFLKEMSSYFQNLNGQSARRYLHFKRILTNENVEEDDFHARINVGDMASTTVLIVPGIFGDCVDEQSIPFGDGLVRPKEQSYTESYAQYKDLGLRNIRALRISGRASSEQNALLIADELLSESLRDGVKNIIIVAYSKGLPDTLSAFSTLQSKGQLPSKLKALVSVAGVVMGTPIADQLSPSYTSFGDLSMLLGCPPSKTGEVISLTTKERSTWLAKNRLPSNIQYYSIVAYTSRDQVAPALLPFFDGLYFVGMQNDGQVPSSNAILPYSELLAEVNSDHWDFVLPLNKHFNPFIRNMTSGREFPREALFRATVKYVKSKILD